MQRVRWSRNIEQHAAKKATSLVVALMVSQTNHINSTQNAIKHNENVAYLVLSPLAFIL